MENQNLNLYNKLRVVPQDAQKSFNNGRFSGTDINSMWRLKRLTEEFGVCGIGWRYEIVKQWTEKSDKGEQKAFCNINLYVKVDGEWSMAIPGTGGNSFVTFTKSGTCTINDECYKMALTDAIGNACKSLGMGADIYWDNDRTNYTNGNTTYAQEDFDYISAIDAATTVNELVQIYNNHPTYQKNEDFVARLTSKKHNIENNA